MSINDNFPSASDFATLSEVELANSQSKRRLVVLLADISHSMNTKVSSGGTRVEALNRQLEQWVPTVREGGSGNLRDVEFAIITFGKGGVRMVSGDASRPAHEDGGAFVTAANFRMGPFRAGGVTPMVEAINRAISLAQDRQRYLQDTHNLNTGQPRLLMFSDGQPTDDEGRATRAWLPVADRLRAMRLGRRLYFLAFGVPGVDQDTMRQLAPDGGFYDLHRLDFRLLLELILKATTSADPYVAMNEALGRKPA